MWDRITPGAEPLRLFFVVFQEFQNEVGSHPTIHFMPLSQPSRHPGAISAMHERFGRSDTTAGDPADVGALLKSK